VEGGWGWRVAPSGWQQGGPPPPPPRERCLVPMLCESPLAKLFAHSYPFPFAPHPTHTLCLRRFGSALLPSNCHETAVKVGGYILGEFGFLLNSEEEGECPRAGFFSHATPTPAPLPWALPV
jgi:hypothetical protein